MRIILFFLSLALSHSILASNLNVTVVVPDKTTGNYFWDVVRDVNKVAAASLHINLETVFVDNDRFAQFSAIEKIAQRKVKPDYLIFRGFYGHTKKMFDLLEANQVSFITIEQNLSAEKFGINSQPQEIYQYWIGQIIYDNKAGGELLLKALINKHQQIFPNKKMYITGIAGDFEEVSANRQYALDNFIAKQHLNELEEIEIEINQIVPMLWDPKIVAKRFPNLNKRYPYTTSYWCAGDQMALKVLEEHKKLSDTEIVIGGFDWMPPALQKIKTGEMTASVGGHFLMVAAAMIKIVDYHNGNNRFLTPPLLNKFELINQDNVDQYLNFMESAGWNNIDYTSFLSTKNAQPPIFNIENMINQ